MKRNKIIFNENEFFMIKKEVFKSNGLTNKDRLFYIYLSSVCKNGNYESLAVPKDLKVFLGIANKTMQDSGARLEEKELVESVATTMEKKGMQDKIKNIHKRSYTLLGREELNKKGNYFYLHYSVLRSNFISPRQKLMYSFLISLMNNETKSRKIDRKYISKNCGLKDDKRLTEDLQFLHDIGLTNRGKTKKVYEGGRQHDITIYEMLQVPEFFFTLDESEKDKTLIINRSIQNKDFPAGNKEDENPKFDSNSPQIINEKSNKLSEKEENYLKKSNEDWILENFLEVDDSDVFG